MKKICYELMRIAAICSLALPVSAGETLTAEDTREFSHVVRFELGDREFSPGDSIIIKELRGTSGAIAAGERYCVTGSYTLNSHDEAELSFFATSTNRNATPIDPRQTVHVRKGSGTFRLIKTMNEDGYLHVSFYAGNSFGGVYFGAGNWVLHDKHHSSSNNTGRHSVPGNRSPSATEVSLAGPNKALFDYLGNPVEPPATLEPAYSKEGLLKAVQTAARDAGVSLKRVEIDDSEYPFVIGFVCQAGDKEKVVEQIKRMKDYETSGGVGSHTWYAMNIIPYRAFPPEAGQRIYRRLTLREAILGDRISAGQ